ncbi:MAG: hypothetical protein WCW13_01735 [archaeon]|jgi:hypothetical protein
MVSRIGLSNFGKKAFWKSAFRITSGALRHFSLGFYNQKGVKFKHKVAIAAIYNNFTKLARVKPNKEAYRLGQAFNGYVLSIDPVLDNPNYGPRRQGKITLSELKSISISKQKASEFVVFLKKTTLSLDQKKAIIHAFSVFRKRAVVGVAKTFSNPFADYSEVLEGVKATAGDMFGTWVEILGFAHGVPKEKMANFRESFSAMSTGLQFVDDAFDCLNDFGNQQNLVVSLARRHKHEFEFLKNATATPQHVSFSWIKKNLPQTFVEFTSEFDAIVEQIPPEQDTLKRFTMDAFYGW